MRPAVLLAVAGALAAAATATSSPGQTTEPCPRTFAPGFEKWSYPSPLAWGRTGTISARRHFFTEWNIRHIGVGVGNQEPTEHSGLGLKYDAGDLTLPISIRRGAPGVRVKFKWTLMHPTYLENSTGIESCEQTKEIFVRAGLGLKHSFRGSQAASGVGLVTWSPVGSLSTDCGPVAVLPAALTVTDGIRTRTVAVPDQCVFDLRQGATVTRKAGTWSVSASPLLGFALQFWSLKSASFPYRLTVGNQVVTKGTLVAHVHSTPDRIIWQGTDDFVNVCINGLHQLRSKNLRLYCVIAGNYSVTFTRRP